MASSGESSEYRSDVDGLRGIAVALIVAFHFSEQFVPGGFVGVDVFFVISGWLITTRIVREMQEGTFSFTRFLSRRVRRIVPASFMCIALVIGATGVCMSGVFRSQVLGACRAAVLSSANMYFALFVPSGYFDPSAQLNPVLHLWSLGVEEQFYLVWPLYVKMLVRLKQRYQIACIAALILGCALIGQLLYHSFPKLAYYTLITRSGELAVGACLVFLDLGVFARKRWVAEGGGLAGLSLLVLSTCYFSSATTFPGFLALVPCTATALIICSGSHSLSILRRMLSFGPFVLLGTISYSVYLYHWPVLAFLRYLGVSLEGIHGVSALLYILAGATVSYVAVETPFRFVNWQPRSIFLLLFIAPCCLLLTSAFIVENKMPDPVSGAAEVNPLFPTEVRNLSSIRMTDQWSSWSKLNLWDPGLMGGKEGLPIQAMCTPHTRHICMDMCEWGIVAGNWPCPCVRDFEQCWFGAASSTRKPILLLGDSNAAAYVGLLEELALVAGFRVFCRTHPGAAPWIFQDLIWKEVVDVWLARFDVVALGAQWATVGTPPALEATVRALVTMNKTVILLGQAMVFPDFAQDCPNFETLNGTLHERACAKTFPIYNLQCNEALQKLAVRNPSVLYWDANTVICKGGTCSPYCNFCGSSTVCRRVRCFFEHTHIGYYGSKLYGDDIVREQGVPWTFLAATALS
jgi:peptidoglycan/LPS O-acetylase OafA/YrhL